MSYQFILENSSWIIGASDTDLLKGEIQYIHETCRTYS